MKNFPSHHIKGWNLPESTRDILESLSLCTIHMETKNVTNERKEEEGKIVNQLKRNFIFMESNENARLTASRCQYESIASSSLSIRGFKPRSIIKRAVFKNNQDKIYPRELLFWEQLFRTLNQVGKSRHFDTKSNDKIYVDLIFKYRILLYAQY